MNRLLLRPRIIVAMRSGYGPACDPTGSVDVFDVVTFSSVDASAETSPRFARLVSPGFR